MAFLLLLISLFLPRSSFARDYDVVSFHGLNQSLRSGAHPGPDECTARLVNHESHTFIENTIASLKESLILGADVGHFNVRRTRDHRLVAFHDAVLECRTDRSGKVREKTLSELREADVGYGYTPDDGKTFPVRGLGKGAMPTLEEILRPFPSQRFAINDKDADSETVELLRKTLTLYPKPDRARFYYLGEAAALVRKEIPGIQVVASSKETKACWTTQQGCENRIFALPLAYVRQLEAQIPSFLTYLHKKGSKLWIFDVNSAEDAEYAKPFGADAIGTYRIDVTRDALKH